MASAEPRQVPKDPSAAPVPAAPDSHVPEATAAELVVPVLATVSLPEDVDRAETSEEDVTTRAALEPVDEDPVDPEPDPVDPEPDPVDPEPDPVDPEPDPVDPEPDPEPVVPERELLEVEDVEPVVPDGRELDPADVEDGDVLARVDADALLLEGVAEEELEELACVERELELHWVHDPVPDPPCAASAR